MRFWLELRSSAKFTTNLINEVKFFIFLLFLGFSNFSNAQVFDTLVLLQENSLLFGSDDWKLNQDNHERLDSILITAHTSDRIILEGHTDEVGSETYNQNLSFKRVNSIKALMLAAGVAESKIQTNAFGESLPVKVGSSELSYKLNRRVSIRFYKLQKMRIIHGQVVDMENGEGLKAKVKLTGKNFIDSTMTHSDGKYSISVPDKKIYKLEASAENHFFEQRFIKVSSIEPSEINLKLPEIKIGGVYTLPNFNFKSNLPVLLESSVPTLDQLYELLSKSTFCVEIEGHVNLPNEPPCRRGTKYHQLSVDRAEMVFGSMEQKGISPKRMLPKGYGNWQMLYPKTTNSKEMSKNRRVEIKIIDCKSEELLEKYNKK